MEYESFKINKLYFNKNLRYEGTIKKFKFALLIILIFLIILISFLIINYKINKNKKKIKNKTKINNNLILQNSILKKTIINLKKKYKYNIKFYKDLLQLYIENRTAFYIKGREQRMKSQGRVYNDSNIVTIQDKYNWLIIHENPEKKAKIVDKILLHDYSKKILGKDICVPIIKIYNNSQQINLKDLPDKFVLKCNHGSGMNILCNNKKNFDLIKAKRKLNNWMTVNYGLKNFEYQYINVNKKIFAEQYLCDNILDYKFYCFNGEPKFIRVQRHLKGKSIHNYYNLNFTLNEIETNMKIYIRRPDIKFPRPKNLELMIDYARKLSADFTFVRVDLYEVNDTVYLGELTFTSINVYMPYKDRNQSLYLGSLLDITKKEKF